MKYRFFLVFVLLILALPGAVAAAPASASLPLDSWIYPALDKLAGLGLIDSSLQGSRPYSRLEAARQTREARDLTLQSEASPLVDELLRRLESELSNELAELSAGGSGSYFQPLREGHLEYVSQKGDYSRIVGTAARQHALNYNNFGIDYGDGHNGRMTLETEARLGNVFLLNWRPQLLIDEETDHLRTLHGTATLALGPFQLSAGRESLWWGQGRHGSLVLTNNAKPLDMVRLTNPAPTLLPWVFKYLGPFRFDIFLARLDDYVANAQTGRGDDPYFSGLRFNFKPLPWLELGASRAVIYGGDDIDVGTTDYLTILGGKNLEEEDNSNSVAAIDARLRLPFLWGLELYGEMGGEDEANAFLAQKAYLYGLFLPRIEPSGRASFRIEHADLTRATRDGRATWYKHHVFHSGYTYDEKILGHHAGGGAKDTYAELEVRLPHDLTLALSLDYEKRGSDQPVEEKHLQPGLFLSWQASERLCLSGELLFDRVKNADYRPGNDQSDHLARFGLSGRW